MMGQELGQKVKEAVDPVLYFVEIIEPTSEKTIEIKKFETDAERQKWYEAEGRAWEQTMGAKLEFNEGPEDKF